MARQPDPILFKCDTCGGMFAECEFVETIEERLCERCASGIDSDMEDEEMRFGLEDCEDGE